MYSKALICINNWGREVNLQEDQFTDWSSPRIQGALNVIHVGLWFNYQFYG